MKLYIKYMVSIRCKMVVKEELDKLGLCYVILDLGTVELMDDLTTDQRHQLNLALLQSGLELMDDKKAVLKQRCLECFYPHY